MVTPISRNLSPASNIQRAHASVSADIENVSVSSDDSIHWSNRIPKKSLVKQSIKGIRRFLTNVSTLGCMKASATAAAGAVGSSESNGPFVMNFERSDSLFINPTPKERELVLKQLNYSNSILMSDNNSYRITPQGVFPTPHFGTIPLLGHSEFIKSPSDLITKNNVTIEFLVDKNHLDDRGEPTRLVKKTIRRGESSSFKTL